MTAHAPLLVAVVAVLLLLGPVADAGCHVERVSIDSQGNPANSFSQFPTISADGRIVAFQSEATNLVPGDTNDILDVFVHDRITGITERASVDSAGNQASDPSGVGSAFPAVSADGRIVAFESDAANLVAGDTNGTSDIFVHDRAMRATERVSVDSAGNQANDGSVTPSISSDGRYVAFVSFASNLGPRTTSRIGGAFVHDRVTGVTELVSVDSAGTAGNDGSSSPSISGDGRHVAFNSSATNLVPDDSNGVGDVFVHDRATGVTERASLDSVGNQTNAVSAQPSISADGRVVAFMSYANNLVPGDASDTLTVKIFVHDRQTGLTELTGFGTFPSLSGDERYVAFRSGDIFVRDRITASTSLVSVAADGNPGEDLSDNPVISVDGRAVAFESDAGNLVPGGIEAPGLFTGAGDIFVATDCERPTCPGDCNGDGPVTIDELLIGVNIALGNAVVGRCLSFDADGDNSVTVNEVVRVVEVALNGCNLAATDAIPYRLVSDSTIVSPEAGDPPKRESLNGTFVLVPTTPQPPNTLFDFTIQRIRFRSGAFVGSSYAIDGGMGFISATTLDPTQPLTIRATVTIDGEPVQLEGRGSSETFSTDPHPTFTGLKLSGSGYQLTIFALPEL